MKDIYLYEGSNVLKNLLNIRKQDELDEAEADYVSFRLKDIAKNPLQGHYDYNHLLLMHRFIFQDLYEWAGQQRKVNIFKEEAVLGGLSIDYSDVSVISCPAAASIQRCLTRLSTRRTPLNMMKPVSCSMYLR